jgi:hypothetical protein
LNKSLFYQVLTKQGMTPQGHSQDVPPPSPVILYAGQVIDSGEVTATPTP